MSFNKSVPKRLKLSEYNLGVEGKNFPIPYIPEKDPVQEALEKSKKTNTANQKHPPTTRTLANGQSVREDYGRFGESKGGVREILRMFKP